MSETNPNTHPDESELTVGVTVGDTVSGFRIDSIDELPEFRSVGIRATHIRSGADIYHVYNNDRENLFGFAFRTLPSDSTGVAHILEHTVLCGSQRFPVKDPFLLLLKGSMKTFLNAMTFPDKTVYPASSIVEADLFNIMKVYGDAVFFPLLKKEMFRQEGHRVYFNSDGELELTGIVYNEMKGNYSSHDSIAAEWAYRSLLQDTAYAHDSGGDPTVIPELTYEAFKEFHRTYYHPSNALIFLYGDITTEKYLSFLDKEFLSRFEKQNVPFDTGKPAVWKSPRVEEHVYPAEQGEDTAGKSSVTMNWLLGPVPERFATLAVDALGEILLGNSGSPLQKALIESGLGEDLSGPTGLEGDLKQLVFSVGLRGTDPEKREEIEKLILDTLTELSEKGIDPEIVEGALRTIEFRNRELKGRGPFGLRLLFRSLRGWVHGAEPAQTMVFADIFSELRKRVESEPRFYQDLIKSLFLDNTHRSTVVVKPEPGLQQRQDEALRADLDSRAAAMSPEVVSDLKEAQRRLEEYQNAPDPPEAVSKIPFLKKSDLPKKIETIESEQLTVGEDTTAYLVPVFTNGIVYLDFAFDMEGLPEKLIKALPMFTAAFDDVGLPGMPYDQVARKVSLNLGGLGAAAEASAMVGHPERVGRHLFVRMKVLERSLDEGLALVRRLLLEAGFDNERRIGEILQEVRSDMKSSLLPAGHNYAATRAARGVSRSRALAEAWSGVTQYLWLAGLDSKRDAGKVGKLLSSIQKELLSRSRLTVNITCSPEAADETIDRVSEFVQSLPAGRHVSGEETVGALSVPPYESLVLPAGVSYVATVLPGAFLGTPQHGHERILAHLLSTSYLWEKIRMQGGAYGAFAFAYGLEGAFAFASYRDPHTLRTMKTYRDALKESCDGEITQSEIDLAVAGILGGEFRPLSPAEKGAAAFRRTLRGVTDSLRQNLLDTYLSAGPDDIKNAAVRLLSGFDRANTVVMAGPQAIETASAEIKELQTNRLDLPV